VVTVFLVAIIVALMFFIVRATMSSPVDAGIAARTAAELHRARRQLETGILRAQMKSDAARIRREFDEELEDEE
jgi:hypothetical protein